MRARAVATVDLDAVRHNVRVLRAAATGADLMAIVKADGYGHGAAPVARAALDAGASALGVVTPAERGELRADGIDAPVLVLGPLHADELEAIDDPVVAWTPEFLERADGLARRRGRPVEVHLKLDTGMGRLGAQVPHVAGLAEAAQRCEGVRVVGLMTHFATADERSGPNAAFFNEQLVRFRALASELGDRFPEARAHAANSAAVLRDPASGFDMVRCGIAIYGGDPFGVDPTEHDLRPALRLTSWLASVKHLSSRDSAGYGRRYRAPRATRIGVVPIGYGDGYARAMTGVDVLVGGRRVPVVGAVSMDQITVDLGPEAEERVGDQVVVIGAQGDERITLEELADHRDTINYEITCALSSRVRREYLAP